LVEKRLRPRGELKCFYPVKKAYKEEEGGEEGGRKLRRKRLSPKNQMQFVPEDFREKIDRSIEGFFYDNKGCLRIAS